MIAPTCSTVVGVFNGRTEADRAIEELGRAGFSKAQIGLVTRDQEGKTVKQDDGEGKSSFERAAAGVVAGAGIGGLVGMGVLAGVIPVVGPAIAAGTLATILQCRRRRHSGSQRARAHRLGEP